MITEERLKYILDNLRKYNECSSEPLQNKEDFREMQKKYGWIVLKDYKEKKEQIINILNRLGFKLERGTKGTYWRYFEHLNLTVRFTLGESWNRYYDCISCFASYQIMKGRVEQRTPRVGDIYYENGIMKTVTSAGIWTGD